MKRKLLNLTTTLFLLLYVFSFTAEAQQSLTPETALKGYLENGDQTFKWEVKDSYTDGHLTAYNLLLTSQKWRDFVWTHQLTILVPDEAPHDDALLFVTGGSNKEGVPNWKNNKDDDLLKSMSMIATSNKVIVALLRQTPNQPLFGGKTEDELISYTLHNYKKDKDYTWPLLFPMVKSAVRAMDAVQEFSKHTLHKDVNKFIISGASKRGWTTWLTGASDKRVEAIAPMVIDVLNMPVSLEYQIKTWGDYSIQIQDYVNLGIPQSSNTPDGKEITTMIDPYSYRDKLTMPKMIFMGTNDEYWVVDNVKNYYDSIPGNNMLHYVPNVGHGLGDGQQAMGALSAFVGTTIQDGMEYSASDWTVSKRRKNVKVSINTTADRLVDVIIWSATSSDKDFRNDKWESESLGIQHKSKVTVKEQYPKDDYKAFYIDLKYENPNGATYTQSTRVFVTDSGGVL